MEKYRAIPEGYVKVGELAKKAGVTVRTLQYYDKEGLLSPSGLSEGGFRLYTDKDAAKLVQIMVMKQLGFTLSDIKKRLTSFDTSDDIVNVLTEHARVIRKKVELLSESLGEIEALKEEINQMESVDFKKLMAILMNLQMKNKHYWMIKHFDDDTLSRLSENMSMEKAKGIIDSMNSLFDEAVTLKMKNIPPESEKGQKFAKKFWETVLEGAGGDLELLEKIGEISKTNYSSEELIALEFIEQTLEVYFENQEKDSEGEKQND